jgi:hypothetical protein
MFMTHALPEGALVRDLDHEPLSPDAEATLRRARVFLYGAAMPARRTALLLAGYGPDTHRDGVFRLSILSGERSFDEWRLWRALRPPHDPDLPEQVASLEAFADRWLALARAAAARLVDPGDRNEVETYLAEERTFPSRTWRAKAMVQRLRHLKDDPTTFYQEVADELAARSFEAELVAFDETLKAVQAWIGQAPIDEVELADMHRAREDAARHVREWLEARGAELAELDEVERTILGLGEVEPPAGFEPPIALLAKFEVPAKA